MTTEAQLATFNQKMLIFPKLQAKHCYIFASLFCMSKRDHLRNKEKCFLFHFESSTCS